MNTCRRLFWAGLVLAPSVLLAAPAHAHVLLDVVEPRGDGTVDLVFTFDHGCRGQKPTDGLEMTVPEHTVVLGTTEPKGWERRIGDGTIRWSGPGIADGDQARFVVTARVGATPGETIRFPVTQTCTGDSPYAWDDPGDGDPEPAPRFVATGATVDPTLLVTPDAAPASGAGPAAIVAALGIFGLAAAGTAWFRAGRAHS